VPFLSHKAEFNSAFHGFLERVNKSTADTPGN